MVASTNTMRRFGPSGSLIEANIAREHIIAVIAKSNRVMFFDSAFILQLYQKKRGGGGRVVQITFWGYCLSV